MQKRTLKIILLGPAGAGKSQLCNVFTKASPFNQQSTATIGVEFSSVTVTVADGSTVRCQIWDTAGQERFRSLTTSYYRGTDGVLVVFDLSRPSTFDDLDQWLADLGTACVAMPALLVVGNKSDLERAVSIESARAWAASKGAAYAETSAKTGDGVESAFNDLVRTALALRDERAAEGPPDTSTTPMFVLEETVAYGRGCCV
jgi:small GTP-binding protein